MNKTCSYCGRTFPATTEYFPRKSSCKDGLSYECKTCHNIRSKRWYAKNREHKKAYAREYHKNNREKANDTYRRWREHNRKRYRELSRRWAKEHSENLRINSRRRRARKKQVAGDHTAQDIKRIYKKQKGKCLYCDRKVDNYHVDHFVPLVLQGKNSPDNLVISCPECNLSKNSIHPFDWHRWNGQFPVEYKEAIYYVHWLKNGEYGEPYQTSLITMKIEKLHHYTHTPKVE